MSTQTEMSAVTALIRAYGEVLSAGNAEAIGGFYAIDGTILPNGHKTVDKKQLDQIAGDFLKATNFKIEFEIGHVAINGEYAIVESAATTSSSRADGKLENKTTRDLFILRKHADAWKIYRYIFNNAK